MTKSWHNRSWGGAASPSGRGGVAGAITNLAVVLREADKIRRQIPRLAQIYDEAVSDRQMLAANDGWRGPSEFFRAVGAANDGLVDQRLVRAPLGASEVSGPDGGFIVPSVWAQDFVGSIYAGSSIAPLCSNVELSGVFNGIKLPAIDETSRADGSRFGGAKAYMLAESDALPTSVPRVKLIEFSSKKMAVYLPITNELLSDTSSAALNAYVHDCMFEEGGFLLSKQIIAGSGAGTALGILNATCTISVAKETGQAAASISQGNVNAMWSRMALTSRKNACWLCSEDVMAQVEQFAPPLFMPQGANGNPFPLLRGRPVIEAEQCSQLGTVGDLILADLSQYRIYQAPARFALSVHKGFDVDQSAFRFVLRFDGKPLYSSPVVPWNGSNVTRSPFVLLAAR